jgi:hypothetical protein
MANFFYSCLVKTKAESPDCSAHVKTVLTHKQVTWVGVERYDIYTAKRKKQILSVTRIVSRKNITVQVPVVLTIKLFTAVIYGIFVISFQVLHSRVGPWPHPQTPD